MSFLSQITLWVDRGHGAGMAVEASRHLSPTLRRSGYKIAIILQNVTKPPFDLAFLLKSAFLDPHRSRRRRRLASCSALLRLGGGFLCRSRVSGACNRPIRSPN
jgi:hypothetical protein